MGSALTSAFNRREAFLNGGNAAVKQENELPVIGNLEDFELPECLKELSLQKIFENGYLSDNELEKLKKSHANDNLPLMPTDPTQIDEFIAKVSKTVSVELMILKSSPLSEEEYLIRFQKLQIQAAYQLLAECLIGEDIRQMKAHKGVKAKGKATGIITKTDAIAAKYPRLGARRSRDFQKLFIDNVWEAIKTAFERGELPTRALALSYGIVKKARTGAAKTSYNLKRWRAKDDDFETAVTQLELAQELKACSLFCNIGVGTSLLEKFTNIKIVVANEKDPRRGRAHRRLYPDCETIIGGIDKQDVFDKIVEANKRHGAKLLLASPPCQEASLMNTSKDKGKTHRAALFEDTLEVSLFMKLLTGLHLKPEICSFPRYLLKIIGANRKFLKQPRNDEMVVLIQYNIAVTIGIPYIFIADWCMVCPFPLFAHFFKTAYYIITHCVCLRLRNCNPKVPHHLIMSFGIFRHNCLFRLKMNYHFFFFNKLIQNIIFLKASLQPINFVTNQRDRIFIFFYEIYHIIKFFPLTSGRTFNNSKLFDNCQPFPNTIILHPVFLSIKRITFFLLPA